MILHVCFTLSINQTYIVCPPTRFYSGPMRAICTICMYLIHDANIRLDFTFGYLSGTFIHYILKLEIVARRALTSIFPLRYIPQRNAFICDYAITPPALQHTIRRDILSSLICIPFVKIPGNAPGP